MSHLHIPDGFLPLGWVILGFVLTGLFLGLAVFSLRRRERAKVIPRIAILSAVMLLAMGLPLPVIGYHVNLTVLTGIVAGPAEGFIAAFITNLLLSLTAHGGVTVVGLNTLITGLEIVLGWALWHMAVRMFRRPSVAAAVVTVITLVVSTTAMLGVIAMARVNPSVLHVHGHGSEVHMAVHPGDHAEGRGDHAEPDEPQSLRTFAKLVYSLGWIGWIIEAAVVASVVQFIAKARPSMLESGMNVPCAADMSEGRDPRKRED